MLHAPSGRVVRAAAGARHEDVIFIPQAKHGDILHQDRDPAAAAAVRARCGSGSTIALAEGCDERGRETSGRRPSDAESWG